MNSITRVIITVVIYANVVVLFFIANFNLKILAAVLNSIFFLILSVNNMKYLVKGAGIRSIPGGWEMFFPQYIKQNKASYIEKLNMYITTFLTVLLGLISGVMLINLINRGVIF